ncbi:fibronectin type III domain-containing protein [Nocardioides korecus]
MTPDASARRILPPPSAPLRVPAGRRGLHRGSLAAAALAVGLVCAGTTPAPADAATVHPARVSALVLDTPISVTAGPSSTTTAAGTDATFTVEAHGDPAPDVQWMVKTPGDPDFFDVDGATSSTLVVPAPTKALNGAQYLARLTTSSESIDTDPATLTVTGQEPGVPQHLVATQTGVGRVTLTWDDPVSHGDSALSTFETSWSGGQFGSGDSVPAGTRTETFTGLGTGRYTFGVAAANLAGPGPRATTQPQLVLGAAPALQPSSGQLVYGQRLGFTGLAKPGSRVAVERALPGGPFRTLATVTASSTGSFRVPASTPTSSASYRARTVGGQPGDAGIVSVASRVTAAATRVGTRTYRLHGSIAPARANQLVTVSAVKGSGSSRRIGTARTDRSGSWNLRYRFPSTGTWTVTAVSAATRALEAGRGSTRTAVR